jgi:HSP20 family protein
MLMRRSPIISRVLEQLLDEDSREVVPAYSLAMDVKEEADGYSVMTSLPGVNPDEIDISFHEDVLTISAETKTEERQEGARYVLQERRYGKFSRSLRLPSNVDADKVTANYENGVLKVFVPKSEVAQPRKIAINTKA